MTAVLPQLSDVPELTDLQYQVLQHLDEPAPQPDLPVAATVAMLTALTNELVARLRSAEQAQREVWQAINDYTQMLQQQRYRREISYRDYQGREHYCYCSPSRRNLWGDAIW